MIEIYKDVAITMLGLNPDEGNRIHIDLRKRLDRVNTLCHNCHGNLVSRQAIAMIICQWEIDNPTLKAVSEEVE